MLHIMSLCVSDDSKCIMSVTYFTLHSKLDPLFTCVTDGIGHESYCRVVTFRDRYRCFSVRLKAYCLSNTGRTSGLLMRPLVLVDVHYVYSCFTTAGERKCH